MLGCNIHCIARYIRAKFPLISTQQPYGLNLYMVIRSDFLPMEYLLNTGQDI